LTVRMNAKSMYWLLCASFIALLLSGIAVMGVKMAEAAQLPLTGATNQHDPTLFKDGDTYYISATGGGLYRSNSLNGPWINIGSVPKANWTNEVSRGGLWAPHVQKIGDTFYYYYSQSNFGTNNSAIGVKTTKTPGDPSSWQDLGRPIISSGTMSHLTGETHTTMNAIDAAVHQNQDGKWWIVWGSHFDGIYIQQLEDDLVTLVPGTRKLVASRGSERFPVPQPNFNRIEGPSIFERDGYFYLVVAWDWCCRGNGNDNTYKVVVGRSKTIDGPYLDKGGVDMAQGGGSIILNSRAALEGVTPAGLYRAPGGMDFFIENGTYYMVYHAYRPQSVLGIREVDWHGHWPVFYEDNGSPYDLRDGAYYKLVNQDGTIADPNSLQNPVVSNRCLTAEQAGNKGDADVVQAECSDSQEQIWQLEREDDGFYRLRSVLDDRSYCLTMDNASGADHTDVSLKPCRGGDNPLQQWYFDDTGHGFHRLVVKKANLALEIENDNGVVGTDVVGNYRRDGDHQAGNLTQAAKWPPQQWRLVMVDPSELN